MTSAFGGQRSIQLSYGCLRAVVDCSIQARNRGAREFADEIRYKMDVYVRARRVGICAQCLSK